jgi:TRAP-type mannitol/chloroaromatic compound transport system permease small subunit
MIFSFPFVSYSYAIAEVSDAPGGLPYRWVVKSVLPVSMFLLLVAGISRLSRVTALLFDWPRSSAPGGKHDVN